MMGKASGNLVCLDFDHCDSLDVLNDVFGDCLNRTLVVRSGNGYHIYLKVTDVATKSDNSSIATMDHMLSEQVLTIMTRTRTADITKRTKPTESFQTLLT